MEKAKQLKRMINKRLKKIRPMIKSKPSEKGTVKLICSNGVEAVILTDFKKVKTFYKGKQIEEFTSENLSVIELCKKLEGYAKGQDN